MKSNVQVARARPLGERARGLPRRDGGSVGEGTQLVLSVIFGLSSDRLVKHRKRITERDTLPLLR